MTRRRTGATSAIPVKGSVTVVDMPLQEIIDGGHAINVHLSAEEIDTYIACGDIGGAVTTDEGEEENELIIGLGRAERFRAHRYRLARRGR